MPEVRWVLNRHPWILAVLILIGLGTAMWAVTNYIQHTVRPRQRAALEARIAEAVSRAEGRYERGKFARALEDYRHVLRTFDADLTQRNRGHLTNQIGLCHLGLAEGNDPKGHLDRAVTAFLEALDLLPLGDFPAAHASTQNHLGDAYRQRFQAASKPEHAREAIAAYQAALALYAETPDAVAQAQTLNRLGNVHRDLYQAGNPSMEPALQFYEQARAALAGRTGRRCPWHDLYQHGPGLPYGGAAQRHQPQSETSHCPVRQGAGPIGRRRLAAPVWHRA